MLRYPQDASTRLTLTKSLAVLTRPWQASDLGLTGGLLRKPDSNPDEEGLTSIEIANLFKPATVVGMP